MIRNKLKRNVLVGTGFNSDIQERSLTPNSSHAFHLWGTSVGGWASLREHMLPLTSMRFIKSLEDQNEN